MNTTLLYDHFIALGGAEKVSLRLADTLPNCSLESAYADKKLFSDKLRSGQLKHYSYHYFNHWFPTMSLFLFYLLRYKLCDKEINLLATGIFSPLVLFRNRNVANSIVYFHTFPSFINLSFNTLRQQYGLIPALAFEIFTWFYTWFLKQSVKQATHVFANSNSVKDRYKSIGIDTKVLYPGVDLEGLLHNDNKGYFLSTARLEANKRVELIIEAFMQLQDYELHMVGGGTLETSLKERSQLCDNIKFLGWQRPEQIKEKYNSCIALVYLPDNEYFGIAPVEAMAAGKPTIGVAEGGLLETINDQRLGTLLSSPIKISDLRKTIINYAESTDKPESILFRQESAKRFQWEEFVRKLMYYME